MYGTLFLRNTYKLLQLFAYLCWRSEWRHDWSRPWQTLPLPTRTTLPKTFSHIITAKKNEIENAYQMYRVCGSMPLIYFYFLYTIIHTFQYILQSHSLSTILSSSTGHSMCAVQETVFNRLKNLSTAKFVKPYIKASFMTRLQLHDSWLERYDAYAYRLQLCVNRCGGG